MNAQAAAGILYFGMIGGLIGLVAYYIYCRRSMLNKHDDMIKTGADNTAAVAANTLALREHAEVLRQYLEMQKRGEK